MARRTSPSRTSGNAPVRLPSVLASATTASCAVSGFITAKKSGSRNGAAQRARSRQPSHAGPWRRSSNGVSDAEWLTSRGRASGVLRRPPVHRSNSRAPCAVVRSSCAYRLPGSYANSFASVVPISAGVGATAMPAALSAAILSARGALAAGDDRAGVTHALAGRRGLAADERGDRLLDVVLDELRGALLGVAADLADHEDRRRARILVEPLQRVDEVGALDRIAADADRGRLAEAERGELVDDLVRQRAGARHDADAARLVDVARHDADLALAGRDHAGAVRADQHDVRVVALEHVLDADHVAHRDALGDRDDRARCPRPRPRGSSRRRTAAARRSTVAFAPRCRTASSTVSNIGTCSRPATFAAALAGRDAGDDVRAVLDHLLGVERAGRAGHALDDEPRVVSDEDAHLAHLLGGRDDLLRAVGHVGRGDDVEPALGEHLLAELDVRALEAHDERHLEPDLLDRRDHARGDRVALHDAAEDVDEDRLHVGSSS